MTTSGPNDWTAGGVALGDEVGDGDGDGDGEPTVGEATPEARGEEEGSVTVGAGWQLVRKMARPSPTAGARRLVPRTSGKTRPALTGYDLDRQRGQCERRWGRGLRWGRDVAGREEKARADCVAARRHAQGWHLDAVRSDTAGIRLTHEAVGYRAVVVVRDLVPDGPAGMVERGDVDSPGVIPADGP